MFDLKKLIAGEKSGLEEAIDELLNEMKTFCGDDEEYAKMVTQLDVLYKLKEVDHKINSKWHVDGNTLVIASVNLIGILAVVKYEQTSVITSKVLNLIPKLPFGK